MERYASIYGGLGGTCWFHITKERKKEKEEEEQEGETKKQGNIKSKKRRNQKKKKLKQILVYIRKVLCMRR